MQAQERNATLALTTVMACRMLGLFMVISVISAYASHIHGATAALIGLAIGIYGLSQALLQIPFGSLSDHLGRKPVISFGLLLFIAGSIIAALSHGITGLIIGRAVQGAGAVGSSVQALLADLTLDENRSKAMAMFGLGIGSSFTLAMVLGPFIQHWGGLAGIFWVSALLGVFCIVLLYTVVPQPRPHIVHPDLSPTPGRWREVLTNTVLLRLDVTVFIMHAMSTALLVALPLLLTRHYRLNAAHMGWFYLLTLLVAFVISLPCIMVAEVKRKMKQVFFVAAMVLCVAQWALHAQPGLLAFAAWVACFFTAFTLLEACLPSFVSKVAPIQRKGAAMGAYSTAQFLGIFAGGACGGLVHAHWGLPAIFVIGALCAGLLALLVLTLPQPPYLSTVFLTLPQALSPTQCQALKGQPGVADVAMMVEEGLLYAKIDKKVIAKNGLREWIEEGKLYTRSQ